MDETPKVTENNAAETSKSNPEKTDSSLTVELHQQEKQITSLTQQFDALTVSSQDVDLTNEKTDMAQLQQELTNLTNNYGETHLPKPRGKNTNNPSAHVYTVDEVEDSMQVEEQRRKGNDRHPLSKQKIHEELPQNLPDWVTEDNTPSISNEPTAEKKQLTEANYIDNGLETYGSVQDMEKIGDSKGTNEGGIYIDKKTNETLYVKRYEDQAQASCEFIANRIYEATGAPVFHGNLVGDEEGVAYATKYKADLRKLPEYKRAEAQKFFVASAYLMDWDAVGTGPESPFGNLQESNNGELALVDHGGSLLFSGLKGRKPADALNIEVTELDTMRSSINPLSKEVFEGISEAEMKRQAEVLVNTVSDSFIEQLIAESRLPRGDSEIVKTLLIKRRQTLINKFDLDGKSEASVSVTPERVIEKPVGGEWQREEAVDVLQRLDREIEQSKEDRLWPTVGFISASEQIDGQIDFMENPDNTIVACFKIKPEFGEEVEETIANLSDISVEEGKYSYKDRLGGETPMADAFVITLDSGAKVYFSKGMLTYGEEQYEMPDGGFETFPKTKELFSLLGAVKIELENSTDKEATIKSIEEACSIIGIKNISEPPSQEQIKSRVADKTRQQHKLEDEDSYQTFVEQYQQANLPQQEIVFPEYYTAVDAQASERYQQSNQLLLLHEVSNRAGLPFIAKHGLLSMSERYKRGMPTNSQLSGVEFENGGADNVFTRCYPIRDAYNSSTIRIFNEGKGMSGVFSGDTLLLIDTKQLDREDWYAYKSDEFGTKQPWIFEERPTPNEFFSSLNSSSQVLPDNELLFERGVPAEAIYGMAVKTETVKEELIELYTNAGVTEINGIPLDEYIKVYYDFDALKEGEEKKVNSPV